MAAVENEVSGPNSEGRHGHDQEDDPPFSRLIASRRALLLAGGAGVGVVVSGGVLADGGGVLADGAAAAGRQPDGPGDGFADPATAAPGSAPWVRGAIIQLGVDGLRPHGVRAVLTQARVRTLRELVTKARTARELPPRLQFRLRYFIEHESTDDFLQGASDEVYLSAIGTESGNVSLGAGGKPVARTMNTPLIGDVSENAVRDPWRRNPHVLMNFDLRRPADWPRTFAVTLLLVEKDNGDLASSFKDLNEKVGKAVRGAVENAAKSAAGEIVGATIGTLIPGVGNVLGAAVGALAGKAFEEIVAAIDKGLQNDPFTPQTIEITIPDPEQVRQHAGIGRPQAHVIKEMGAHYTIEYDWFLAS
ncbi:hypothetical protein [Actinoplanes sp. DH11]|uniref:hypothetical protein n=1 Tax=Actinoplanes sp. DH11 TaxID=2857011 RepID=UPI001E477E3B|nr:hypothetical protein [Actinoplanes sp. DH11]